MIDLMMDDLFWWQVQQHEEEEWQELLKRDPGYAKWLDELNQTSSGYETIQKPMKDNTQEKAV